MGQPPAHLPSPPTQFWLPNPCGRQVGPSPQALRLPVANPKTPHQTHARYLSGHWPTGNNLTDFPSPLGISTATASSLIHELTQLSLVHERCWEHHQKPPWLRKREIGSCRNLYLRGRLEPYWWRRSFAVGLQMSWWRSKELRKPKAVHWDISSCSPRSSTPKLW
jgi:hypothetical protein